MVHVSHCSLDVVASPAVSARQELVEAAGAVTLDSEDVDSYHQPHPLTATHMVRLGR